jgi:hypothetical protein
MIIVLSIYHLPPLRYKINVTFQSNERLIVDKVALEQAFLLVLSLSLVRNHSINSSYSSQSGNLLTKQVETSGSTGNKSTPTVSYVRRPTNAL